MSPVAALGFLFAAAPIGCFFWVGLSTIDSIAQPRLRHAAASVAFWTAVASPLLAWLTWALAGPLLRSTVIGTLPEAIAESISAAPLKFSLLDGGSILVMLILGVGTVLISSQWVRDVRRLSAAAQRGLTPSCIKPSVTFRSTHLPIRISMEIKAPMLVGYRRPTIVLPAAQLICQERDTISLICAHETEHARRGDNWRLASETLALSMFWWCAPVGALHQRILASREELCDGFALSGATDTQRHAYAKALIEAWRARTAPLSVSGFVCGGRALAELRLRRIVGTIPDSPCLRKRAVMAGTTVGSLALSAVFMCIWPFVTHSLDIVTGHAGFSIRFATRQATNDGHQHQLPPDGVYTVRVIGKGPIAAKAPLAGIYHAAFGSAQLPQGAWTIQLNAQP